MVFLAPGDEPKVPWISSIGIDVTRQASSILNSCLHAVKWHGMSLSLAS